MNLFFVLFLGCVAVAIADCSGADEKSNAIGINPPIGRRVIIEATYRIPHPQAVSKEVPITNSIIPSKYPDNEQDKDLIEKADEDLIEEPSERQLLAHDSKIGVQKRESLILLPVQLLNLLMSLKNFGKGVLEIIEDGLRRFLELLQQYSLEFLPIITKTIQLMYDKFVPESWKS